MRSEVFGSLPFLFIQFRDKSVLYGLGISNPNHRDTGTQWDDGHGDMAAPLARPPLQPTLQHKDHFISLRFPDISHKIKALPAKREPSGIAELNGQNMAHERKKQRVLEKYTA